MKPYQVAIVCSMAILVGACGGAPGTDRQRNSPSAEDGKPTPTPSTTQTPKPPDANSPAPVGSQRSFDLYPADTRTGVKDIDVVIEAVVRKDSKKLAEKVKYTMVPCTVQPIADSERPTCPAGTADNTPIEMFAISSCQRAATTSPGEWINAHFPEWFKHSWQPVAAYEVDFDPTFKPVFQYATGVAFAEPEGHVWTLYLDSNGAVIGENLGCGLWNLRVRMDRTKFILPPKRPA